MKKLLAGFFLYSLMTYATAAFINNGDNTTTDTSTGLDWLALTVTQSYTYNDAATNNPGWRYATETEVHTIFDSIFVNFVATGPGIDSNKAGQTAEVAVFSSIFGITATSATGDKTFGFYRDGAGTIRTAGYDSTAIYRHYQYGSATGTYLQKFGAFMVRTSSVSVPEASSVLLMAFGLLGLFATARRKA